MHTRAYLLATVVMWSHLAFGATGQPAAAPLRILPLGDSITQQDEPGYRYLLWKRLLDVGIPFDFIGTRGIPDGRKLSDWPEYKGRAFDADHEGHAGWKSSDLLDGCSWETDKGKLSEWLTRYTPDVVLLHIGTNDVFQGMSTDESVACIGRIIDALQTANSKVVIYLAKIIPLAGDWADDFNVQIDALNARLDAVAAAKATAESKVYTVDQHAGFDGEQDTDDAIHPNAAGAQKMAERWADALLYDGTPQPRADAYQAVEGKRLLVETLKGVLLNDFSLGHAMRAELATRPQSGRVTLDADGAFRYRPKRGFVGKDAFTYRAVAEGKSSAECTVTVTVVDNAPVANDDRYYLAADTPLTVDARAGVMANDVCHRRKMRALLVAGPSEGTLVFEETGAFTYTPRDGYVGQDFFQYRVDDGAKRSGAATVHLWVGHREPIAWWTLDQTEGMTAFDSAPDKHDGALVDMQATAWTEAGGRRALRFDGVKSYVALPPLNLSVDALTMTAWVKRDGVQPIFAGLVFCAEGGSKAGLDFGSGPAWSPNHELGYLWNGKYWNFHSGLYVPDNEWCLVALVVTPGQAALYLGQNGKVDSATKVGRHDPEKFAGITRIAQSAEKEGRLFKGMIRDVRVYDRPLSASEMKALYETNKDPK